MTGVLDHHQAVAAGRLEWLEVDRQSGHRYGHTRLGSPRQPGTRGSLRIEIGGLGIDVREHGTRAHKQRAVGRRDEAERSGQELVSGAEARRVGRRVQRGRPVGEGDGVACSDVLAEGALERLHARSLCEERVRERRCNSRDVRLVDGLAAVGKKVGQGTSCSDGNIARSSWALSCTELVSLL